MHIIRKFTPDVLQSSKGVIFNLQGALSDSGCFGMINAIANGFLDFGIYINKNIIRNIISDPSNDTDYIGKICDLDITQKQWDSIHARKIKQTDIELIKYMVNKEMHITALEKCTLTPGSAELLDMLYKNQKSIGIHTNYNKSVMDHILPKLREEGLVYTHLVCREKSSDNTYKVLLSKMNTNPKTILSVGQTVSDILDGIQHGCITCNVVNTSIDICTDNVKNLIKEDYNYKESSMIRKWQNNGCNYWVSDISKLLPK